MSLEIHSFLKSHLTKLFRILDEAAVVWFPLWKTAAFMRFAAAFTSERGAATDKFSAAFVLRSAIRDQQFYIGRLLETLIIVAYMTVTNSAFHFSLSNIRLPKCWPQFALLEQTIRNC